MKRITKQRELVRLARQLKVRPDWHESDELGVTATTDGDSFDNAGFWGSGFHGSGTEMYVTLHQDGRPVAQVNLATLFAWAAGGE
jgi:hypothetical protein